MKIGPMVVALAGIIESKLAFVGIVECGLFRFRSLRILGCFWGVTLC